LASSSVEDLKINAVSICQSTLALACIGIEVIVNDAIQNDWTLACAKFKVRDERGRTK
jgi:hypothetical protein